MIRKTFFIVVVTLMLFPLIGRAQRHEYRFTRGGDLSISIGSHPRDDTFSYYDSYYYNPSYLNYSDYLMYLEQINTPNNDRPFPGIYRLYEVPSTRMGNGYISGAINVGYTYRIHKWFEVSAYLTYSGYYADYFDSFSTDLVYRQTVHSIAATPFVRFVYLNKQYIKLYSGVGLGLALLISQAKPSENFSNIDFNKSTSPSVVGSVNLFGIRLGDKIYGFCELSVGSMGIVTAGMGFKLN